MLQYVIYVQLILSYGGSEAKFSMGCECGRRQKDPETERHCQASAKIEGGGRIYFPLETTAPVPTNVLLRCGHQDSWWLSRWPHSLVCAHPTRSSACKMRWSLDQQILDSFRCSLLLYEEPKGESSLQEKWI